MSDELRYESFLDHLASEYRVAVSEGGPEFPLRLEEVRRLGTVPGAPRREPFALLFSGPPEPALAQGTHRLRHRELGELEIFLVPVGRGAGGTYLYEAVFN